jgi:integrase
MGIRERKRADGTIVFEADVRIANVGRITKTFSTRSQAEEFIAAITAAAKKAQRASASSLDEQARIGGQRNFERAKLADVIVAFRESSSSSNRAKQSLLRVDDFVGHVTVAKLDDDWSRSHVLKMRDKRTPQGKPYAFATIKEHLSYMKIACGWWARRNKVANPFIGVSMEGIPQDWENKRDRRLQTGEFERILSQIENWPSRQEHWRCLVVLALETCARQQELIFAQWSELTHEDQVWRIPAAHTKKKTERFVPLSPTARAAIAELRLLKREGDQRIFEVFPNPHSVSQTFREIVRAAKIENFTFHSWRHEGISRKVLNCRPEKLPSLMKIVGHKDYKSLMRYSHLLDNDIIGMFD